jgi:hypothetical protein
MREIHDCVVSVLTRFDGYTISSVVEGDDHHFRVLIHKAVPGKSGAEYKLESAMVEALQECGMVGYSISHRDNEVLFDLDILTSEIKVCPVPEETT